MERGQYPAPYEYKKRTKASLDVSSPDRRRRLTSVSLSVTSRKSRSPKGRQPATPVDGARAVPAGGGSSPPHSGGSGKTPGRHDDRSATQVAGLGQAGADNARFLAPSQEARTGVELWRSVAAASAVVERRQASARRFARAAPVRRGGLD
jgi:hypothetical protein